MIRLPDYPELGPRLAPRSPQVADRQDRAALASARTQLLAADVRLRRELADDPDHSSWNARYEEGKVTWAEAGESYHNYGVAIDVWPVLSDGKVHPDPAHEKENVALLEKVGPIAREHGFEWGGDWSADKKDRPHVQLTFGRSEAQLRKAHAAVGGDYRKIGF
jgi:hypothetical protein